MDEEQQTEQSGDSLYLQQLIYDEDAGKTWLNFFIQNLQTV